MRGHAEQCVERYLGLSGKGVESLKRVSTPCLDDHLLSEEDEANPGELAPVAANAVLKVPYLARVSRLDVMWAVCDLARKVTKWTRACDKRLHRLISYLHHNLDLEQVNWIGDKYEDCALHLFVDASFADGLEDAKSTTGAQLVLMGPRTFVTLGWICRKQTSVSHSSAESEIVALESALRMEGLPALML